MNPQPAHLCGIKSLLHFSHADSTERGSFVKTLRCASTADAAPTSGDLDKAPFYAPVFASSYGKNEEKKLGGAGATPKAAISYGLLRPMLFYSLFRASANTQPLNTQDHLSATAAAPRAAFKHLQKGRKNAWKQQIGLDALYLLLYNYYAMAAKAKTSDAPRRRRRGRPKLPKGEAKGRLVAIRFTAEDLKAIAAKADEDDQSISEWIRRVVGAVIKERKR